jgi:hypothetical protein
MPRNYPISQSLENNSFRSAYEKMGTAAPYNSANWIDEHSSIIPKN